MSSLSPAKRRLLDFFASRAVQAEMWRSKNPYYYQWISRLARFFVPPGAKVLEAGCGLGDVLAAVAPAAGVGIDFSPATVALAQRRHRGGTLRFVVGDVEAAIGVRETFDAIIASDLIGYLDDIQSALENLRLLCHERTRLLLTQYNRLWEPLLHLGARLALNQPKPLNNWLSGQQTVELLELAGFEVVMRGQTFLCPKRWGGVGELINRTIARLPVIRRLCLVQYFVARPRFDETVRRYAVSVIVPLDGGTAAVNDVVARVPSLGSRTEIIFAVPQADAAAGRAVTAVITANAGRRAISQAVAATADWRELVLAGARQAQGELLAVLPPDLSVAPEELPKFYRVVADGKADCVIGSRLVYPSPAIRTWRRFSLRVFSVLFSWIIGQRVTDVRCPVLALRRDDGLPMGREDARAAGRIGGVAGVLAAAAQRGLKIAEIPVHYADGAAGSARAAGGSFRTLSACLRAFSF